MDWLKYLGLQPAPPDPTMTNPVGTSTMQRLTNPSPTVSPVASAILDSPDQRIGRFWKLATGQAKPAYTGADMPGLAAAGNEALDAGMGWATTTPIRAYHGSPHTFDRFDLSKIGTGEGAQAYGHGLYFAGNEGVARSYKASNASGGRSIATLDGVPIVDMKNKTGVLDWLDSYGSIANTRAALVGRKPDIVKELDELVASGRLKEGSMYEVNLRTSPDRLLDWDKPLSQQPAGVRDALGKVPWADAYVKSDRLTGGQIVPKTPEGAAQLRDAGIDGIQYLDAGSRAVGDGSRNYVIFDDKLIDILRRYGLFGLGMTGGAMGAAQTYAPQGAEQ